MAEEVLQTTYVKVLEGGTQPRDWAAFKPWLFGVIRLTALEWWRKAAGAGDVKAMASLGHALWDETRIPLFEQAVDVGPRNPPRVSFGQGYVNQSLLEIFEENQREHHAK